MPLSLLLGVYFNNQHSNFSIQVKLGYAGQFQERQITDVRENAFDKKGNTIARIKYNGVSFQRGQAITFGDVAVFTSIFVCLFVSRKTN